MGATINVSARVLRPKAFGPHTSPAALEADVLAWLTASQGERKLIFIQYAVDSGSYTAFVLYAD